MCVFGSLRVHVSVCVCCVLCVCPVCVNLAPGSDNSSQSSDLWWLETPRAQYIHVLYITMSSFTAVLMTTDATTNPTSKSTFKHSCRCFLNLIFKIKYYTSSGAYAAFCNDFSYMFLGLKNAVSGQMTRKYAKEIFGHTSADFGASLTFCPI